MKSTITGRVRDWLGQSAGQCFCDECIAKNTGLDVRTVTQNAKQIAHSWGSSRYQGRCDLCDNLRIVTIVSSNVPV
jgi:hypothetical protein